MKPAALALVALLLSPLARAGQEPANSALLGERTLGPVPHIAARDQGDVGFCWAYALSGFMEGEALKKNKHVVLSPEYLALNHMPSLMYQFLPIFQYIDAKGFFARLLLDIILLPSISPQGSTSFSEGLSDLDAIGMVPETFFKQKFPMGKDSNGKPVEIHPTLQEKITSFVYAKLTRSDWVKNYEHNPEAFRKDFFDAIGIHPPKPTDTFVYEGQSYTPITFMKNYLEFNTADYEEVVVAKGQYQSLWDKLAAGGMDMSAIPPMNMPKPLTGLDQRTVLDIARAVLQDQTAVPVTYMVYEDQKAAEASGVFSPANCQNGQCAKVVGGHAVLMTGLKENSSGAVDAIVIKNSWGNIGLDAQGASLKAADRGFFLISDGYLTQAEQQANANGWSILAPKRFLPGR
ncbi:MAG: hypothetical protein ACXWR4_09750 [Bdellovibrionota bacterium]